MGLTSQTPGIAGYSACLGVGKEATFGTGVASSIWIPFESHDLASSNKLSANMAVRRSAGSAAPRGPLEVKGTLKLSDVDVDTIGILLGAAMGKDVVATVSGISTHTFSMAGPLNTYSFVADNNNGSIRTFVGCKIDSLDMSAKAGDYLNLSLGIIGQTETVTSGSATGVTYSSKNPLHFDDLGSINGGLGITTIAGTSYNLGDVSISMKNNVNQHYGSLGGRFVTSLDERQREVSGSYSLNYDVNSGEAMNIYLWGSSTGPVAGTQSRVPLVLTFTQNISASLSFNCGFITVSDVSMTVSKNDTMTQTIKFMASETQTSGVGNADDLQIVLKNTSSANYVTA